MDFTVENHGSIFLLQPLTSAAQTWVDENIPEDAQYFGTAVAVEHRYIVTSSTAFRAMLWRSSEHHEITVHLTS